MTKKLYRSRKDRMIAGVCGGIGEYFDMDPTLIRLLVVLLGVTGTGLIVYFVAAIIIPNVPYDDYYPNERDREHEGEYDVYDEDGNRVEVNAERKKKVRLGLGGIAIFIGISILVENFVPGIPSELFWGIGIIIVGIAIVVSASKSKTNADDK